MNAPVLVIAAVALGSLVTTTACGPAAADRTPSQRLMWRVQLAAVVLVMVAAAFLVVTEP